MILVKWVNPGECDCHCTVADNANNCVYIFNEQDQLERKIGSHGNGAGQCNESHLVIIISYIWWIVKITGYRNLISLVIIWK